MIKYHIIYKEYLGVEHSKMRDDLTKTGNLGYALVSVESGYNMDGPAVRWTRIFLQKAYEESTPNE